ncbi:MAG: transglycosylase SLT domain-containing protein [Rhodospirillales bacterium]|nr:transglycosylase SLT domain-containing protein [Rhodospirillales bacterium]
MFRTLKPTLMPFLPAALLAVLAGLAPAPAWALQAHEITEQICDRETARRERAERIPRHLLGAISLAESGRWDEAKGESFAWPWTVTARGKGHYFPSKQAAIDYVRNLQSQGVSNIDVGCMQINLFYHGENFLNLEEAFDPGRNVAFAAEFLKSHFDNTRSWSDAAALYHSSTPEVQKPYKRKVLRLWDQERRTARGKDRELLLPDSPSNPESAARSTVASPLPVLRPPVQTSSLNFPPQPAGDNQNEIRVRAHLDQGARRLRQMDDWRDSRIKRIEAARSAHLKRAEAKLRRAQNALNNRFRTNAETEATARFASNRRAQLETWRSNRASRDGES